MFAIPPEVWYNESNSLCAGGDGRRGMEQLSGMQQKIYEYIVSCVRDQGYPPSVREIGEAVGLKSPSTVHFHLKHLAQAGVIPAALVLKNLKDRFAPQGAIPQLRRAECIDAQAVVQAVCEVMCHE